MMIVLKLLSINSSVDRVRLLILVNLKDAGARVGWSISLVYEEKISQQLKNMPKVLVTMHKKPMQSFSRKELRIMIKEFSLRLYIQN